MGYWGVVLNNIRNADVILLILDARMPDETRNSEIEAKAEKLQKQIIYVYNKIDLVNPELIQKLKDQYPQAFFTNSNKKGTILPIKERLKELAKNKPKALRVAILGYPNVGKSTILNILTKSKEKVSRVSGTTKKTTWVREGNVRFMDTPGVIPRKDSKAKMAITSSKDIYKTENPERITLQLIEKLRKTKSLQIQYKITITEDESNYEILLKIGKKKNFLIKGGEIDEDKTARLIVSDWQKGKIGV